MSFRDLCLAAFVLAGSLSPAGADEPAPDGALPDALPAECRDLDGRLLASVDCAELEARLAALARVALARTQIEEARAKTAEAEQKRRAAEMPDPVPGADPDPKAAPVPPPEPGRVLEIFGDQARLRWRGGEYLVRQGQRLPDGAWIAQVTLDGVTIADGRNRQVLPFVIGRVP